MSRRQAILIGGAPATGKSTLAAALAPRLGAAVLDLDVATGPLTRVVSDLLGVPDLGDPRIAALTRTPRYDTLLALAEDNLRAGLSVILVAPFTAERAVGRWTAVAGRLGRHGAAVTFVWLRLPAAELVRRLTRRDARRDRDKVRDPEAFLSGVDAGPPAAPHLALDGTLPVAELVDRICVTAHVAIDGKD
jgi:predicted kinase